MIEGNIGPQRRVDFDRPVVEATIGGRQVFLVRPDERRASADEPYDLTVPITTSRMRRAIDIEYDRAAAPYVPSQILGFGQDAPTTEQAFEAEQQKRKLRFWAISLLPAAGIGLVVGAFGGSKIAGTVAGAAGALWTIGMLRVQAKLG